MQAYIDMLYRIPCGKFRFKFLCYCVANCNANPHFEIYQTFLCATIGGTIAHTILDSV